MVCPLCTLLVRSRRKKRLHTDVTNGLLLIIPSFRLQQRASLAVGGLGFSACAGCLSAGWRTVNSWSRSHYRREAYLSATLPPDIVLLYLYHHLEALHPRNMAEAPASSSSEDGLPVPWKRFNQRSRKSGCSNIFTGVNLHQLHRLFKTAGDRHAEHRAKLVWRGMDAETQREEEAKEEAKEEEVEDRGEEAGLAQALVGLRVRARNQTGIRAEGYKDHRWLRGSGYLRIEEPLSSSTVEDQETEEDLPENRNPFKPSSRRLGVARQEGAKHSERYLHRILH